MNINMLHSQKNIHLFQFFHHLDCEVLANCLTFIISSTALRVSCCLRSSLFVLKFSIADFLLTTLRPHFLVRYDKMVSLTDN